jgi:Cu(I)/Ag(I) efflux system membrane protein CusA/SilA
MIDAAIVMIENAHKHLERAPPDAERLPLIRCLHRSGTGAVL